MEQEIRSDPLSSAVMWTWFLCVSIPLLVIGTTAQVIAWPFDPHRRVSMGLVRLLWGRLMWQLGPLWTLRREGFEHLGNGPYVIVMNHASLVDIPAVCGLPIPVRLVAKPKLFKVPGLGWFMRVSGQVCVQQGDPSSIMAAFERSRALLDEGISIIIFPEGTRTPDGAIGPFHKGAFRLAKEAGVNILPIVFYGGWEANPKGALGLVNTYNRFHMRVLEPIDPESAVASRVLARRTRERMSAELELLRAEYRPAMLEQRA